MNLEDYKNPEEVEKKISTMQDSMSSWRQQLVERSLEAGLTMEELQSMTISFHDKHFESVVGRIDDESFSLYFDGDEPKVVKGDIVLSPLESSVFYNKYRDAFRLVQDSWMKTQAKEKWGNLDGLNREYLDYNLSKSLKGDASIRPGFYERLLTFVENAETFEDAKEIYKNYYDARDQSAQDFFVKKMLEKATTPEQLHWLAREARSQDLTRDILRRSLGLATTSRDCARVSRAYYESGIDYPKNDESEALIAEIYKKGRSLMETEDEIQLRGNGG